MENENIGSLRFDVGDVVPFMSDPYKDYVFTLKGSGEKLKHKTTLYAENNKYTVIFTKKDGNDISLKSDRLAEVLDMETEVITSEKVKNLKEITSLNELTQITKSKNEIDDGIDKQTTPILESGTNIDSDKQTKNIDYLQKLSEKVKFEERITEISLPLPLQSSYLGVLNIFEFNEDELKIFQKHLKKRLEGLLGVVIGDYIDKYFLETN